MNKYLLEKIDTKMYNKVEKFVKTIENSWQAPIGVNNIDNEDDKYIVFTLTTGAPDSNKQLLTTISSIQTLGLLQYHSITIDKEYSILLVKLSVKYTDFERNDILHVEKF